MVSAASPPPRRRSRPAGDRWATFSSTRERISTMRLVHQGVVVGELKATPRRGGSLSPRGSRTAPLLSSRRHSRGTQPELLPELRGCDRSHRRNPGGLRLTRPQSPWSTGDAATDSVGLRGTERRARPPHWGGLDPGEAPTIGSTDQLVVIH